MSRRASKSAEDDDLVEDFNAELGGELGPVDFGAADLGVDDLGAAGLGGGLAAGGLSSPGLAAGGLGEAVEEEEEKPKKGKRGGKAKPGVVLEKPRANVYTVLLVLAFVALAVGCAFLYGELQRYDWKIHAR